MCDATKIQLSIAGTVVFFLGAGALMDLTHMRFLPSAMVICAFIFIFAAVEKIK